MVKGAQNVAQAVARSRPALSSWSCMGARRRIIGAGGGIKDDEASELGSAARCNSETILVEHCKSETSADELHFDSSGGSDNEEAVEEELIPSVQVTDLSTTKGIIENNLWFELEKDIHRKDDPSVALAQEEVTAATKEITVEEAAVLKAVEVKQPSGKDSSPETQQFYPPGRIMHMVLLQSSDDPSENAIASENNVGIFETPRQLYSKIRLSKAMINDHYMPMYRKTMELLIDKLAKDDEFMDRSL